MRVCGKTFFSPCCRCVAGMQGLSGQVGERDGEVIYRGCFVCCCVMYDCM